MVLNKCNAWSAASKAIYAITLITRSMVSTDTENRSWIFLPPGGLSEVTWGSFLENMMCIMVSPQIGPA